MVKSSGQNKDIYINSQKIDDINKDGYSNAKGEAKNYIKED